MLFAGLSSPTAVLEWYVQIHNTCAKQKGKLFLSGLMASQNRHGGQLVSLDQPTAEDAKSSVVWVRDDQYFTG